jgi:hypothetical protein
MRSIKGVHRLQGRREDRGRQWPPSSSSSRNAFEKMFPAGSDKGETKVSCPTGVERQRGLPGGLQGMPMRPTTKLASRRARAMLAAVTLRPFRRHRQGYAVAWPRPSSRQGQLSGRTQANEKATVPSPFFVGERENAGRLGTDRPPGCPVTGVVKRPRPWVWEGKRRRVARSRPPPRAVSGAESACRTIASA